MYNNNLIQTIFSFQAESRNNKQQQVIFDKVLKLIPKHVKYHYDEYGNLYLIKGITEFYPCYVAHVDQVHEYTKNFKLHVADNILFATGLRSSRWNRKSDFQQVGVGGDDKAGIYLCIQMLLQLDYCKVVLFKDEEIGCIGSSNCDISFFNDCSFVAQGDRKGNKDFITFTNGVDTCTPLFIDTIKDTLTKYKYKEATGTMTDIGELIIQGVPCCTFNVSCGYYNAHTDSEYQNLKELDNCMKLFLSLSYYSYMQHVAPINDYTFDDYKDIDSINFNFNLSFQHRLL